MSTLPKLPAASIAFGLLVFAAADDTSAQFLLPSDACPGAVQLVGGTPEDPDRVLDLFIPDGGAATCNTLPPAFPFPENEAEAAARIRDIRGDGNGIAFTNNIRGIVGETPEFEATFDGSDNTVINNGDLLVSLNGDGNSVTNAGGFLSGNAIGNDFELVNEASAVILGGMTIEGSRAEIRNSGGIAEGFPTPVPQARGILVVGADAVVENLGTGGIGVVGDESTAVFLSGNRGRIENAGMIYAEGAETLGAGIEGNGTEAQRVTIANTGRIEVEGDESVAAFIEGDFGLVDNDHEIVVSGNESAGVLIEGLNSRIENSGVVEVNGDLTVGLAIDGTTGVIENTGTVKITGNTAIAMGGLGSDMDVGNRGTVETVGDKAVGIAIFGGEVGAFNAAGHEIKTAGDASHGMLIGVEDLNALLGGLLPIGLPNEIPSVGLVGNEGTIKTAGDGAHGIAAHMDEGTIATFAGSRIETTGNRSHGIAATETGGDLLSIQNLGDIQTTGPNSDGINVARNQTSIRNDGTIKTGGLGGSGIDAAGNLVLVNNRGAIETTGLAASGIAADLTNTTVSNSGSIKTTGISAHGLQMAAGSQNVDVRLGGTVDTTGLTADGAHIDGTDIRVDVSGQVKAAAADAAGIRFEGGSGSAFTLNVREGASIEGGAGAVIGGAGSENVHVAGALKGNVDLGDGDDTFTITDTAEFESSLWNGGDGEDTLGVDVADGFVFEPVLASFNFEHFLKTGAGEMLRRDNLTFESISIEEGFLTLTDGAEATAETLVVAPGESVFFKPQLTVDGEATVSIADVSADNGIVDLVDGSLSAEKLLLRRGARLNVADDATLNAETLRFEGSDETLDEAGTLNVTDIEIAATDDDTPIRSNVTIAVDMDVELLAIDNSSVTFSDDFGVTFSLEASDADLQIDSGTLDALDADFFDSDLAIEEGAALDVADGLTFNGGSFFVDGDLNASTAEFLDADVTIGFDGELNAGSLSIDGGVWDVSGDVDTTTASIVNADVFVDEDGSWVTGTTTVGEGAAMEVDGSVRGNVLLVADGFFCSNGFVGFATTIAADGSRFEPGCSIGDMTLGGDLEFGGIMGFEFAADDLFDTVTVQGDLLFTGGLFEFSFLDGYLPLVGTSFDFLAVEGDIFGSDLLSFTTLGLGGLELDFGFTDRGLSFEVVESMTSVPAPGALLLFSTGIAMLLIFRRRFRAPTSARSGLARYSDS